MKERIRIGTRGSDLALAQTNQVIDAIRSRFPDVEIERIVLRTQGDKILDRPLLSFGGKGAFVTEFEKALQEKRIDFAVHSAKDIPMELGEDLVITGVLPRADARDVLVTKKGALAAGMLQKQSRAMGNTAALRKEGKRDFVVGTGSLRRQLQLRRLYPQAVCENIRGNVPTRLQKLRDEEYDGVVLAAAGLERLGLLEEVDLEYRFFSYDEMIPAGGQGIIAIEGRAGDVLTDMVQEISDKVSYDALVTERRILEILNAGCHEAVGTISQYDSDGDSVRIRLIKEVKGKIVKLDETTKAENGIKLAEKMAESVLHMGI